MATKAEVTKAIQRAFLAYKHSIPWVAGVPRHDAREFIVEAARALGLDDGDLHAAWRLMRQVKR